MLSTLKTYQSIAIEELLEEFFDLFAKPHLVNRTLVFKSPTGSGKTVMMSGMLEILATHPDYKSKNFCFIWVCIGKGELHIQSKRRLDEYLGGYPATCLLEDYAEDSLPANGIIVVNFEKLYTQDKQGNWTNRLMREGDNQNFKNMIDATRRKGLPIILVVDESHLADRSDDKNTRTKYLIDNVICPDITIEVSATPIVPSQSEKNKRFVEVSIDDVIKEQMVKKAIYVNKKVNDKPLEQFDDEDVIKIAMEKRSQLALQYEKSGSTVNPLVLIQIPDSDKGMEKRKIIEDTLSQNGVKVENGKLAIWLSDTESDNSKVNFTGIDKADSPVQFLIFKQAIATGWDCPRAQILVKLRAPSASPTFDIQTVGRIMRMPERKHYDSVYDELNFGYVYTNIPQIIISNEEGKKVISQTVIATLNKTLMGEDINLPAERYEIPAKVELEHIKIKPLVIEALHSFGTNEGWKNATLGQTDVILNQKIDVKQVAEQESTKEYKTNGYTKVQKSKRQISDDFQKIIEDVCSVVQNKHQSVGIMTDVIIDSLLERVKGIIPDPKTKIILLKSFCVEHGEEFRLLLTKVIETYRGQSANIKLAVEPYTFNIADEYLYDSDLVEASYFDTYVLSPCYLLKDRTTPENNFEDFVRKNQSVIKWFWKNGDDVEGSSGNPKYFSIAYEYQGEQHLFFPDYLVMFQSGRLGLFETKDEDDPKSGETQAKANALQAFLKKHNNPNLFGGIIAKTKKGLLFNCEENYFPISQGIKGWRDLATIFA
jgi:type III restriction enzyme